MTYECKTCGEQVPDLKAARKHATQGYKTQREAFHNGALHSLELVSDPPLEPKPYPSCARCGHRVQQSFGGWSHHPIMPVSATELRQLRHIIRVIEPST